MLFLCTPGHDYVRSRVIESKGFVCLDTPARLEDVSLPSFVAQFNSAEIQSITFSRSLTNVAKAGATYTASVDVQP